MSRLPCGCIQIYTGDGKGKTTAAFGLAVRAAGHGLKVAIVQFMKPGTNSGELNCLRQMEKIRIYCYGADHFVAKGQASAEDHKLAQKALAKANELLCQGIDVLILDEAINAVFYGLIAEEDLLALLRQKPPTTELVLTGRNATEKMIALADLVTEMKEIRHPYQKGLGSRAGIDF